MLTNEKEAAVDLERTTSVVSALMLSLPLWFRWIMFPLLLILPLGLFLGMYILVDYFVGKKISKSSVNPVT